ncbi:alpha,alpha-trehalose-phosphate synthase (UDP-forming) [Streptomyces sp. NRRL F-5630]|uniref:alpha,alpha-trehalose-phosphate synthase (UDP-forming) n=1 Tax=Streptomyces sp. NRRL F-5630 TaxID=1463864 RepID=UPI003EBFDACF
MPTDDPTRPTGTGTGAAVLLASNRGPVSYAFDAHGGLTAKRGGGGLVSGLSAIGPEVDAVWVCAALSDADREAARRSGAELDPADTGGRRVHMLGIDPRTQHEAYNDIANSVLWFAHHMLWQTPLEPAFGPEFRARWASFESYNRAFAEALAAQAAEGAAVLVQDYHLVLVPGMLRALRPDLRIAHFSHTPWAPLDYYRLLPDDVAEQVLRGILGADHAGFLTRRWADAFTACADSLVGGTGRTEVAVHGLGADADFLRERAHQEDVDERMAALRREIGGEGRRTIVRVDRTELSKNIVRGLHAYRRLLTDRPDWRGQVVHLAFAYPSRQDLEVYRAYTAEVERVAQEINDEFGTADWTPVLLKVDDDFARSLAAYRLADVALVNPIRDGMNLVAKEVPVVSDAGVALVLSREAGAYEELGADAVVVNPYDVSATAEALHTALTQDPETRSARTKRLAEAATALPPARWFMEQLEALGGA